MIEAQPRHLPDSDPTGRPGHLWSQRRSSHIAFNKSEQHGEDNIRHATQNGNVRIAPDVRGAASSSVGVEPSSVMDRNSTLSSALAQVSQSRNNESASAIEDMRHRKSHDSSLTLDREKDKVQKLSPAQIHDLTSSPESIPIRAVTEETLKSASIASSAVPSITPLNGEDPIDPRKRDISPPNPNEINLRLQPPLTHPEGTTYASTAQVLPRPTALNRAVSTPASGRVSMVLVRSLLV